MADNYAPTLTRRCELRALYDNAKVNRDAQKLLRALHRVTELADALAENDCNDNRRGRGQLAAPTISRPISRGSYGPEAVIRSFRRPRHRRAVRERRFGSDTFRSLWLLG
jgi:hypothetical protein